MDSEQQPDEHQPGEAEDGDGDGDGDGQDYVDRSKIDFDPADGLYTGTAVEGTSEIPGPHERDEEQPQ